ncbi:MAG: hypothetical protein EBV87_01995 [Alphaproteobacteria bacterium]|nr:hypothetical protein [Alphaproteobacteria bacterium]
MRFLPNGRRHGQSLRLINDKFWHDRIPFYPRYIYCDCKAKKLLGFGKKHFTVSARYFCPSGRLIGQAIRTSERAPARAACVRRRVSGGAD